MGVKRTWKQNCMEKNIKNKVVKNQSNWYKSFAFVSLKVSREEIESFSLCLPFQLMSLFQYLTGIRSLVFFNVCSLRFRSIYIKKSVFVPFF